MNSIWDDLSKLDTPGTPGILTYDQDHHWDSIIEPPETLPNLLEHHGMPCTNLSGLDPIIMWAYQQPEGTPTLTIITEQHKMAGITPKVDTSKTQLDELEKLLSSAMKTLRHLRSKLNEE